MKKLIESSKDYLDYLEKWLADLPVITASSNGLSAGNSAVLVVDMINGFCNEGVLASPRVKNIIPAVVNLLETAWHSGVRDMYLLNDSHAPDAPEFAAFPAHCVRGTIESLPVQEIQDLEFFDQIRQIQKNTLSSTHETTLLASLHERPELKNFIIAGNCTDLCVYQLAMALRIDANVRQLNDISIIVPENCVATYDTPLELALKIGAAAHPGDLIHALFLHHMALNGIAVVKAVTFKG